MTHPLNIKALSERRRRLGMSYSALAARSGTSEPTVKRILGGLATDASFANVAAIAEALGLPLSFTSSDEEDLRRQEARRKAEKIAKLVQGTSALEGQAVDRTTYELLVERTYHELMAGSRRKLWAP